MSNSLKLQMYNPCSEDFNTFSKTEKGGYCVSCSKEVIDFSNLSDQEIKEYFKKIGNKSVCGRFKPTQLNREMADNSPGKLSYLKWSSIAISLTATLYSADSSGQTKTTPTCQVSPSDNQPRYIKIGKISPKSMRVFTGRVLDSTERSPLSGITVMLKGTDRGTITDFDGRFEFSVDAVLPEEEPILTVSFVGYVTKEIPVDELNNDFGEIILTLDEVLVEEIVLVAGGVTSRRASFFERTWWRIKSWFR